MNPDWRLTPEQAVMLLIDIQESFAPVIDRFDGVAENCVRLSQAAVALNIPVVVSEQYPKGLGHTVQAIQDVLPSTARVFEKTTFGCLSDAALQRCFEEFSAFCRTQVIVAGVETQVCVNQTVHQLLAQNFTVHVISDAVSSRAIENTTLGLSRMQQSGAVISGVEMAIFEMLADAKHPQFKNMLGLIK